MMQVESVIRPLRPNTGEWQQIEAPQPSFNYGYPAEGWLHPSKNIFVISAIEVAKDDDGIDRGPEHHISISKTESGIAVRCSAEEAAWVLNQFKLDGAEEDNHVPGGIVRNFWRTVAESLIGLECKCKKEETPIIEGDYVWRPVKG